MASQSERSTMRKHAREAMSRGDFRGARSLLRHLVEQDPEDLESRVMLTSLEAKRKPPARTPVATQKRRHPGTGFRSVSMLGATALLLVLVVALLLPEGAIFASRDDSLLFTAEIAAAPAVVAPAAAPVVAAPVEQVPAVAFGAPPTTTITSTVPAEPPIPYQGGTCISGFIIDRYHQVAGVGWTVSITAPDGSVQTMTADSDGVFEFDSLGAGTWTVALQIPAGWRAYTLESFQVTLSGSGSTCADVRFKVEALGCLEVIKYDAGGKLGFNHLVGIPGWEMTATDGTTTLTAVTDGTGKAYFYDLAPGTWTIMEEEKLGWQPFDGFDYSQTVDIVSPKLPGTCQKVKFINEQVHDGCIKVKKVDAVGNPLKGWQITVVRDDGTQPGVTSVTDASGYVTFKGLALGGWTVYEEVPDWWRPLGEAEQQVTLDKPGYCEPIVFTNESLGCIDGYKINQLDHGLSGWTITARNDFTGEEVSTTTDSSGYFKFKNLTLGTWVVSEELQTGWEPVTPAEFVVEVMEPFECQHVRFKNKTNYACVDVFKLDAIDGSGLPGWEITVEPAYGGTPVTGTTDGTGWVRFNGLVPGTYIISEEVMDGWVPAGPTSFTKVLKATGTCYIIEFENLQERVKPVPPPGGKG